MTHSRLLATLLCMMPWALAACSGVVDEDPCSSSQVDRTPAGWDPSWVTVAPAGGGGGWAPSWVAAPGDDVISRVHVGADSEGNLVWAGQLPDELDLCAEYASNGKARTFVTKLRPDGTHLWSTMLGGDGLGGVQALAIAANDDIVIGGSFNGTLDYGGGSLVSAGREDAFVAKLDPDGAVVWAHAGGSAAREQAVLSVVTGEGGEIAITGKFSETIDWGTGPLLPTGDVSMFVAKLDANGEPRWAVRYGSDEVARGHSVSLDAAGDVVIAGGASGVLDLGGASLVDPGGFLAKLDGGTGAHRWSQALGDRYGVLAVDPQNRYLLASSSSSAAHLSKYDPSGALLLDQEFSPAATPTTAKFSSPRLAVDSDVVVLGFGVLGGVDFGGGKIGGESKSDLAIAAFDHDGSHRWSAAFASDYYGSEPTGIALTPGHDVFLGGTFMHILDLGFVTLDVHDVEDQNGFLLLLDRP